MAAFYNSSRCMHTPHTHTHSHSHTHTHTHSLTRTHTLYAPCTHYFLHFWFHRFFSFPFLSLSSTASSSPYELVERERQVICIYPTYMERRQSASGFECLSISCGLLCAMRNECVCVCVCLSTYEILQRLREWSALEDYRGLHLKRYKLRCTVYCKQPLVNKLWKK